MPTKAKSKPDDDVPAFIAALQHPREKEILALRDIILGVDPSISEAIKWNAPSFRTGEHFATMHLRAKTGIQLILHAGAKKRELPTLEIADPSALLEWPAPDRAIARFTDLEDLGTRKPALEAILKQWIRFV